MAKREAFEYAGWCAGPSVDISPLTEFPICTLISYAQPTLALHHVDMTIPDIAPPPLCPCIWTLNTDQDDSNFSVEMKAISVGEIVASLEIAPAAGLAQDCCAPEFNVNIDMELPCMPFEPSLDLAINTGLFSGSFGKDGCDLQLKLKLSIPPVVCSVVDADSIAIGNGADPTFELAFSRLADCTLKLSGHISLPCMPFNVTAAQDITIGVGGLGGEFELALSKLEDCGLKLSGHLSLPCMPFNVAAAQDIQIGGGDDPVFDVSLTKLENCTLKLSQHISLPCMPFNVTAAQDIVIGGGYGGDFDLKLEKLAACTLKLSGHISLPGTGLDVLISAQYVDKTFKIWKQPIKAYAVEAVGSPIEIFVAVSCSG